MKWHFVVLKKKTVEISSANYSNQKSDERFKSVKDVYRLDDGLELYAGDAQCSSF